VPVIRRSEHGVVPDPRAWPSRCSTAASSRRRPRPCGTSSSAGPTTRASCSAAGRAPARWPW